MERFDAATVAASEILRILHSEGPRSRAELGDRLGVARPTISLRLDPLLDAGLIGPEVQTVATGGRRAERLGIVADCRLILAADVGTANSKVAILDLSGKIFASRSLVIEVFGLPEPALDAIAMVGRELLQELDRPEEDLLAVGIGLPCPIDHRTGRPSKPPRMAAWDNFDVSAYVRRSFDVPVLVDNDVNITAIGERAIAWPREEHFMFVKVSTGIGAGVISGGRLQQGATGVTGDVGHLPVSRGAGVLCQCGSTGCVAAIASGAALVDQLRAGGLNVSTARDICGLVAGQNLTAIDAVRQAGRDIGEVLVPATAYVNPSVIAIGGSLAEAGDELIAGIRTTIYENARPRATDGLQIVRASTGRDSGVIGAALLVIEHSFSPAGVRTLLNSALAMRTG